MSGLPGHDPLPPIRDVVHDAAQQPLHVLRAALRAKGRPLQIVAALLVAAVVAHLLLGDELGVHGAWAAVLLAAGLFALLVVVDAGRGGPGAEEAGGYDVTIVALAGVAIAAAVACLYLPLPWGGLGAAVVLVGLIAALRLSAGS